MTTMTSLLGGLAAVVVLYAIGGVIRGLPPILRALLAGLIPLLAYFALIVGRWPGLDVVAMHISVFLVAGLVLFAVSQFRRHSVGRMHWAPKLLTAFFLGLVVVNGSLLYIATKGLPDPLARWWLGSDGTAVYSGFSGVVTHGQAAAKAVSSELSQAQRESVLGWQVEVVGLDSSEPARATTRTITCCAPACLAALFKASCATRNSSVCRSGSIGGSDSSSRVTSAPLDAAWLRTSQHNAASSPKSSRIGGRSSRDRLRVSSKVSEHNAMA